MTFLVWKVFEMGGDGFVPSPFCVFCFHQQPFHQRDCSNALAPQQSRLLVLTVVDVLSTNISTNGALTRQDTMREHLKRSFQSSSGFQEDLGGSGTSWITLSTEREDFLLNSSETVWEGMTSI